MSTVAVLIPTYGRTDRLDAVVANLRTSVKDPDEVTVVLVMEPGEACVVEGALVLTRPEGFGTYADAINYGYRNTSDDLLFAGADDLDFHLGWLDATLGERSATGAEVIGTNDLGNPEVLAGEHATHYLVSRRYLDEVGGVFDQGRGSFLNAAYEHDYTDTEFIDTARSRGVFVPCLESVVEHNHPAWNKAAIDSTYLKGAYSGSSGRGARLYAERRQMWRP